MPRCFHVSPIANGVKLSGGGDGWSGKPVFKGIDSRVSDGTEHVELAASLRKALEGNIKVVNSGLVFEILEGSKSGWRLGGAREGREDGLDEGGQLT